VCLFRYFARLSLDPPYNFFSFSQSLLFVGFLKISLKTVYPTIGIDGKRYKKIGKDRNRCRKMGKDTKRYEKIAKDSGCVGECGFSCDVFGFCFLFCACWRLCLRGDCVSFW